jgi:hypothetical protein
MPDEKKQEDIIADDKKSIGFDFQYYYFLWKLLLLQPGETVGLEVKDDVHSELSANRPILFQVKHTIQKNTLGAPVNLTTLDSDLWKTFSNWAKIITDVASDRSTEAKQLAYIEKTEFVLASNKTSNSNNKIIVALSQFKVGSLSVDEVIKVVNDIKKSSSDADVKKYIEDFLALEKNVIGKFCFNIHFDLDENDILEKCREAIKADKIKENRIESVFKAIDSSVREDNFFTIRNGEKVIISFDAFYQKFRRYYDFGRNDTLIFESYNGELPDKIQDQIFIKQLIDIGDINIDDIELMAKFSRFRLCIHNNLEKWLQCGELTTKEEDDFYNNAITEWENEFRKIYRGDIDITQVDKIAQTLVDSIRQKKLEISNQPINAELSNGSYYELSNVPRLGWLKNWEIYKP